MATEFDDSQHYGFFLTGTTLTSETGKTVRMSELVLAALRAAGVFDNMEDGTTAPVDDTKLWLDKNSDPAILKEWDSVGSNWQAISFNRLFERTAVKPLTITANTGSLITVDAPTGFHSGKLYSVTASTANTGALDILVSGVGTYNAVYPNASELSANEVYPDRSSIFIFQNGRFELLLGSANWYEATTAGAAATAAATSTALDLADVQAIKVDVLAAQTVVSTKRDETVTAAAAAATSETNSAANAAASAASEANSATSETNSAASATSAQYWAGLAQNLVEGDWDNVYLAIGGTAVDSDKLGAQLPAYYLNRANHTGTQTSSTISDFSTATETVIAASSSVITSAERTKLAGIETGATADQTGAEIKALYEAESDTNAYTDAEKAKVANISITQAVDLDDIESKLGGIQAGAQINTVNSVNDQTGAVVLDADDIDDTSTTNKFTTSAEAAKLAGIEAGAQVNTVSSVNGATGAVTLDTDDISDEGKANRFTSAAEITKLAGIQTGAQVNAVNSVNGQTGVITLDADDISDSSTTNKFTTAAEISKLAGIESGAQVVTTARVRTAGAVMDDELTSPGIKSLNVPDNTVITTLAKTLLGGVSQSAMQSTLGVYSTASVDTALAGKSNTGHTHDDRYYTETEIDTKLALKFDQNLMLASVQTLLDSTTSYSVGSIIQVGTSIRYEVVSSGEHVTTVDGVKLKVLPENGNIYHIEAWGPTDAAGIQAAWDDIRAIVDAESWILSTRPIPNKYVCRYSSHMELDAPLNLTKSTSGTPFGMDLDWGNGSFVVTGTWDATTPAINIALRNCVIEPPYLDCNFLSSGFTFATAYGARINNTTVFRWGHDDDAVGVYIDSTVSNSVFNNIYARQRVNSDEDNYEDEAYWNGSALRINGYDFEVNNFEGGNCNIPIEIIQANDVTFTNCHPFNGRPGGPARSNPLLIVNYSKRTFNIADSGRRLIKFANCYLDNGIIEDHGDCLYFENCQYLELASAASLTQPYLRRYCFEEVDGGTPFATVSNCQNLSFGYFDSADTLYSWGGDDTAVIDNYDEMKQEGARTTAAQRHINVYSRSDNIPYKTNIRRGGVFNETFYSGASDQFRTQIDPSTGDILHQLDGSTVLGRSGGVTVSDNWVGTVVSSGAGPIVERGSNANGGYIRFADGLQICISGTLSADASTATGSIYRSDAQTWTFPATFAAGNIVGSFSPVGNSSTHWGQVRATSYTAAEARLFAPASTTGRSYVLMAVGQWF